MFEYVREDLRRALNGNQHAFGFAPLVRELLFHPGTQCVLVYRLGSWIHRVPPKPIRWPLKVVYAFIRYFVALRVGIFVPPTARIGPGFLIHGFSGGIAIADTKIGKNFTIIGGGIQMDYEVAEIGDDVIIGPGTKINGKIRVGHRARTGPNCVVQQDIPDDCVAFGNPARIIGPVPRITYEQGAKRIVPATTRPQSEAKAEAASSAE